MRAKPIRFNTLYAFAIIACCLHSQNLSAIEYPSAKNFGFIENKGQLMNQDGKPNPDVLYLFCGQGIKLQLRTTGFSYEYIETTVNSITEGRRTEKNETALIKSHRIDVTFEGMNKQCKPIAEYPFPDPINYYISGGSVSVSHFRKITYRDIYTGIDAEFLLGNESNSPVKYNFIVHAGADLSLLKLSYLGQNNLSLENGVLELNTTLGKFEEHIPQSLLFSKKGELVNKQVSVTYQLQGNEVSFVASKYPPQHTLVIDPMPTRQWGTYYGGGGPDYGYSIATDNNNNVLVTGYTLSTNNIASSGAYQTSNNGVYDVFVVKFNSNGLRLWATFFGGAGIEKGLGLAIDKAGNIYVTGDTSSPTSIATTGAQQTIYGGGIDDAYLIKFDANGKRRWATYFGSTEHDFANGIALDNNANVIITGHTESPTGIATFNGYKTTWSALSDIFVAKYDSSGVLKWATYYGDIEREEGTAVACDASNNIFVCGFTESTTNISTTGCHQPLFGGPSDAFLLKLDPSCALKWCTYYGGSSVEQAWSVSVDKADNIYMTGNASSFSNIASVGSFQQVPGSVDDAFLAKFSNNGVRRWGTYLGGNDIEYSYGVCNDVNTDVYLIGYTSSPNAIATTGAYLQTQCGNSFDTFIEKFDSSGSRKWGTYYGANGYDEGKSIAIDSKKNILITGNTSSIDSIASLGSHQANSGGGYDAFVVKFCEPPSPTITAPKDTICKDDVLSLYGNSGYTSYSWSTGATTLFINLVSLSVGTHTFTLTVSDSNNCPGSITKTIVVLACTGIHEKGFFNQVQVFPNPVEKELNVNFELSEKKEVVLQLISSTGQIVYSQKFPALSLKQHHEIDVSRYAPGLYLLQMNNGNGISNSRIILQ